MGLGFPVYSHPARISCKYSVRQADLGKYRNHEHHHYASQADDRRLGAAECDTPTRTSYFSFCLSKRDACTLVIALWYPYRCSLHVLHRQSLSEWLGIRHQNTTEENVRGRHVLADHLRNHFGHRSLCSGQVLWLFTVACDSLPPPSRQIPSSTVYDCPTRRRPLGLCQT
ncbi:hypothetical protein ARMSODRAFT_185342 [Armillaria solidipes]|uniref:Uncharacterized protein n=1 Tax=Armillaria solidipes TaxID=1076256 RepID=A0A2H3C039_9AGAR|nr:hypothetical protein ARMSODRAFT_185342 [Armillaria solidipes]